MTTVLGNGLRTTSYLLGCLAIGLAVAAMMTSSGVADIMMWARNVLGWTFVALLGALVFLTFYCWVRLLQQAPDSVDQTWAEAGVQAANGVATLALTFTLLGISLGIGTLATHELTPDTVQAVIRRMTANFSLAFMTTVIGLPISALLRGLIVITNVRRQSRDPLARSTDQTWETPA